MFEPQTLPGVLEVICDADHAGDLGTRKSRSGMAVMWGAHLFKHGVCSAEHHRTEQWRVGKLRVAQVVSSCARNLGNAERLALWSGM